MSEMFLRFKDMLPDVMKALDDCAEEMAMNAQDLEMASSLTQECQDVHLHRAQALRSESSYISPGSRKASRTPS